jgi:hypothetical protein
MIRASKQLMTWATALVATFAAPLAYSSGLVVNGDFESGSLSGWTQTGNTDSSGVDPSAVHNGAYGAFFGPEGAGGISQTFATVAGMSYKVDFWLALDDSAQPNLFSWTWSGASQVPNYTNTAAFGFTEFSSNLIATGASTALSFSFTNPQSFWLLDDVSVTSIAAPIPEPENILLLAAGLVALIARRRLNRRGR